MKIRRLQGKYNLAVKMNLSICITAFKSSIFKLSDISAMIKGFKTNEKVLEFLGALKINKWFVCL